MRFSSIVVAGGFGFLGSHIVHNLKAKGYSVNAFSRRTQIDIMHSDLVLEFLKKERPDVVVNCAAHVGGIAYNQIHPIEIYEDNLRIGFNLLRASFDAGVKKFVNIMPNCTYPGCLEIYREANWWDGPMHETVLTYGMPRKALWVHAWVMKKVHSFNSVHLILPNLYGPGDHFDPVKSHALGALIRKVVDAKSKNSQTVEIWGTGKPIREWGYVEDAAEGIVLSLEKYDDIEVMNIGQGKGYTITETAEMIRNAVGWGGHFKYDLTKPDGAPKKILDVSKMRQTLNWQPKTPIEEGIRKTVKWFLESERN